MSATYQVEALLAELRDHLGRRRIARGIELLQRSRAELELLPGGDDAALGAGMVAQWTDAGFDGLDLVRTLLARLQGESRSRLGLMAYLHVRAAEGMLAMAGEEFDSALEHFRIVRCLRDDASDPELIAIVHFWAGRCLRKMGRYSDALSFITDAEELAFACGYSEMAAAMQVTRSWLSFQEGKLSEATDLLHRAQDALAGTDDYLTRGNIQSAYGRIARRQGRYERALLYFEAAIVEYRMQGAGDSRLARTLVNLALVNRLLALQFQKAVDQSISARRSAESSGATAEQARRLRSRIEEKRAAAHVYLDESAQMYGRHPNQRGLSSVHITKGYLLLDAGDLEGAALQAEEAYRAGEEKRDYLIQARARTLQCMVELAALEEQVGDMARHRHAAEAFASDAVHFAGRTQNKRLLARAHIWQGLTLAAEPCPDLSGARTCCDRAMSLLAGASEGQHVWNDLERLKAAVLQSETVEPMLRAWSSGVVGNRSFQDLTEDFARVVIPKVWEREGRKVARVAQKLSISPKKVRRVLSSAGLLNRVASAAAAADMIVHED